MKKVFCNECSKEIKKGYVDPDVPNAYLCESCFDDIIYQLEYFESDLYACPNGCCLCCGCSCMPEDFPDETLYSFE